MPDKFFSHLNPILFLQTFVAQSVEVSAKMGGAKGNDRLNYIEQLGLTASGCFETAYRQELPLDGPLNHDKYAGMIVEIKNKIGGNFSRESSEPGMVRVVNRASSAVGGLQSKRRSLENSATGKSGAVSARTRPKMPTNLSLWQGPRPCSMHWRQSRSWHRPPRLC